MVIMEDSQLGHRLSLTPDRQCTPHLGFFFILPSLYGEVEAGWALCPFTSNCYLKLHKISNITDQLKSLSERQYRQLQQAYTMNDSRSPQLFALPIGGGAGAGGAQAPQ